MGETWCSESEGMFSESESDDSECKLDHCRQRKGAALEVDGVPHACVKLVSCLTLDSKEKCLDLNNIFCFLTGRGLFC